MDIMDGPEEDRPDRMEASSYGDSQPSTDNENEDSEDENSELENSGLDQDEIETDDEKEKEFDDKLEEDSPPVDEVLYDEQESTSKIRKIKTQTSSWAESNIMESDEDTDDEDTRLRQLVDLIPKNFDITYKRPTTYSTTLPLYLPKSTKKRNDHFSVFVKQPQSKEEVKSFGPHPFDDRVEKLINDRLCGIIEAIRFGAWDSEFGTKAPPKRLKKAIKLLSQNKKNFSKLTGLFIGDIPENDNCKLSWIQLTDITPLLTAFDNLMHLKIRGSMGLQLHPVVHNNLRSLTIQCVGLPSKVLANICMSDFPLLERLELWLGTEIDSECSLDDLESLLFHDSPFIIKFPKLRFLALRNTSMTDELVPLVLQSDLMCQLEWLDFSKGTLSDVGAAHLFGLSNFTQIRALDITHHYCSATMIKELTKALHFISIKAGSGNALDKFPPEQRSSAVPEIRE